MKKLLLTLALALLGTVLVPNVMAQNQTTFTIKGKVLDADGNPLSGVTIKVIDTNLCAVSNADGTFALSGVKANQIIEISYIGMETIYTTILKASGIFDLGEINLNPASIE